MTSIVLVPNDVGVAALAHLDGVRPVSYTPGEPLPAEAAGAEVLVAPVAPDDEAVTMLRGCPRLRMVQLLSAGAEGWIGRIPDGVLLSDCRGAHGGVTAEWIVGALLAVYRELPAFLRAQDQGRWEAHETDLLLGKRVLLVGAGDLAGHAVRRLAPFEVSTTLVASRARDGVHGPDELPRLLGRHDAVVLVVPLTTATRGMVDAAFLAAMPDGAVLVNAARGPVVDTGALLAELDAGRLRAALDVTDPEPLPPGHPLWHAPNLLLTPHVAGSVPGSLTRAYAVAATQIARFVAGERPPNAVVGEY